MKLKPYYLGLVLVILLGLNASSAFGVGNTPTSVGSSPLCVDTTINNASVVKIAGKVVAPGGLVRVPTGSTCLPSETPLSFPPTYVKTILVSPGADNVTNGNNLRTVMASATAGTLVKVEPGTYDLVTTTLTMKQGVDLEGSGEGLTTITSQVSDFNFPYTAGTVVITNTSEIRFLTIANTMGNYSNHATVYANGVNKTAKLTNVTVTASGTDDDTRAGIANYASASPTIQNSTISATGSGANSQNYSIFNFTSSSPTIQNSTIFATGGAYTYGIGNFTSSSPTIQNSTISASGGTNNHGIYNASSATSTILNSKISASGGAYTFGIYNTVASAIIQNSTISATGGTNNRGIDIATSSAIIQNSIISATGGSTNYGIDNSQASPIIQNSTLSASGGSIQNFGINNVASSSPTIQNSTVTASGSGTNTSIKNTGSTAKVGSSQLGVAINGTGFTCVASYNANFVALGTDCT